jgi:hypothetical protein
VTASQWIRKSAAVIVAAILGAMVVGYVGDLQAGTLKKGLGKMRYYGGPKSPMWRG